MEGAVDTKYVAYLQLGRKPRDPVLGRKRRELRPEAENCVQGPQLPAL